MTYLQPLLRNIRAQVLMQLVTPYQRIRLDFIAKEINILSSPLTIKSELLGH